MSKELVLGGSCPLVPGGCGEQLCQVELERKVRSGEVILVEG